MRKFPVFVPCYNEQDAIAPMSEEFKIVKQDLAAKNIQLQVVWVNDCSSDSTLVKIQEQCSANSEWQNYIHHESNRGLVGVLETMLSSWSSHGGSNPIGVGLLDGDNSHPSIFFNDLVDKLIRGYDVAISSRFQVGSIVEGVPGNRQFLSWGMSVLFRLVGRVPNVRDYSCGFRAYSPAILNKVGSNYRFKKRSFACMVELLMECHKNQAFCAEVPFILRYDQKLSESKMRVVRTIKETLGVLLGK